MPYFLFIVLFVILLFSFIPVKYKRKREVSYFLLCILLILAAGFRHGWADYQEYINGYYYVTIGESISFEISFVVISKLVNFLFGNVLGLFVIYSILGVSLKFIAIKELTQLWFISIAIYLSNFYILHELIQIRVGVATGFFLLSIKPIYDRNLKKFLFFFICAFLFHYSSLIMLPLWFLNKNKPRKIFLYFIIPIAFIIYFLKINLITTAIPIPAIKSKIELYQAVLEMGGQNKINVFNLVFLAKIIIYYLLTSKIDLIQQYNKYSIILIKIYSLSLFSFPAFALMPVIGFRINEFLGVVEFILFPLLVYIIKPQLVSKLIVIVISIVFLSISIFYSKYFFI